MQDKGLFFLGQDAKGHWVLVGREVMIKKIIELALIGVIIGFAYTETGTWTTVNLISLWFATEVHWSTHEFWKGME